MTITRITPKPAIGSIWINERPRAEIVRVTGFAKHDVYKNWEWIYFDYLEPNSGTGSMAVDNFTKVFSVATAAQVVLAELRNQLIKWR